VTEYTRINTTRALQSSSMPAWTSHLGITREVLIDSARATVASVVSMLLALVLKLPEFYWAPISAIVVVLSTIDPRAIAWQRFVGTALGAVVAAAIATYFKPTWIVYGIGIFLCGIFSALLRIGTAYRFAAITLSIVLLIAHTRSSSIVAWHRFIEVSLGIGVALAVSILWPPPAN
jgi:uncharacterized membrane protein YgaE (UPF0421/DUF939 family)